MRATLNLRPDTLPAPGRERAGWTVGRAVATDRDHWGTATY